MAVVKKTTAKKTPTKKKAAKKSEAPNTGPQLPPGFKPTSNQYAPSWNPGSDETHPKELIGEWGAERTITIRRGRGTQEQRVCNLTTDDGVVWTIWASAMLTGLFDEAQEGSIVYIRYDGEGNAKKGQHPPKLFTTAIAE